RRHRRCARLDRHRHELMTHGIDSQAHRRPDGQCTARARGALGVRHPAPQQVRVELMLQGDPCDRHARTHALGNHRRIELVRVPTAPNPTLGNLSLDSVHVSTSFLVDIMLLVATTRYKMSSLAAYGRAGGGGIWTARLGALLLLMHLLRSDSTDWPR